MSSRKASCTWHNLVCSMMESPSSFSKSNSGSSSSSSSAPGLIQVSCRSLDPQRNPNLCFSSIKKWVWLSSFLVLSSKHVGTVLWGVPHKYCWLLYSKYYELALVQNIAWEVPPNPNLLGMWIYWRWSTYKASAHHQGVAFWPEAHQPEWHRWQHLQKKVIEWSHMKSNWKEIKDWRKQQKPQCPAERAPCAKANRSAAVMLSWRSDRTKEEWKSERDHGAFSKFQSLSLLKNSLKTGH